MNRFDRTFKTLLFLAAMVVLLAACGQRGPLYLPAPEQDSTQAIETKAKDAEEIEAGDDNERTSSS